MITATETTTARRRVTYAFDVDGRRLYADTERAALSAITAARAAGFTASDVRAVFTNRGREI